MDIYICNTCRLKVKSETMPGQCIHILSEPEADEDDCYTYRKHHPYEYNCHGEMTSGPYHNWNLVKSL